MNKRILPDSAALDMIQNLMDAKEWEGADTLDQIADIVRDTGREVRDTEDGNV